MRYETKEEIKAEVRADFEVELLSEQQHLVDEIAKHKQEVGSWTFLTKRFKT